MRVESYGEIAAAIGEEEDREIAPLSLNYPLGFIRDQICRTRGLPWLHALAVNAETWLPGESFPSPDVAFGDDERVLSSTSIIEPFAVSGNRHCKA